MRTAQRWTPHRLLILVAVLAAIGSFATTPLASAADSASASDLQKEREAIEAGKAKAAELRAQIDASSKAIEEERAAIEAMEAEVRQLREETDKLKKSATSGSPFKYNDAAEKYNAKAMETINRREALEASIVRHNELVGQLREQAKVVNELVVAYNEKLARKAK